MSGKVAVVLFLTFVALCFHNASGACTAEQKEAILRECEEYIKPGYPLILPSYRSVCCDKVRLVPGRDMKCIVDLLTPAEKTEHNERKIRRLEELCEDPDGHPPPHYRWGN